MLKAENRGSTRREPQEGQTGAWTSRLSTSFSNTLPHFRQRYSKIGMAEDYSLALPSLPSFCFDPDRGEDGGVQVKRDRPGMRGKTKKYTTKNRTTISKFSIRTLYVVVLRPTTRKARLH